MATQANEGGAGGPTRRQPLRRGPSTPYDRPLTARRGVREGGWIAKLVDPASRLIASGASKFFSSMLPKRLTAPPRTPEEGCLSREDASQVACMIPSPETQEGNRDGASQANPSGNGGIAELEQLLRQKTFTRAEFDRLAELLRSRTVETSNTGNENNNDDNNNDRMEKTSVSAQGVFRCATVHESLAVPIPEDEAASPAELAKAYMGSRPLKLSPPGESFYKQFDHENVNLLSNTAGSKRLDLSVAPRSVIRFSGIPEHREHNLQMTRPPGRSAIYRMSRSPYFKVGELSKNGFSGQSAVQLTPSSLMSSGKKVLKRGSSALDIDYGSSGPIRRIRQKSNFISPVKSGSKSSITLQRPLMFDERKNETTGGKGLENRLSTGLASQSSETAQKLFQQLDRFLPSPKEKSSELKSIDRDDSPSKLTFDMLNGSAMKSMKPINSSDFFSMQGSGKAENASPIQNFTKTQPQKEAKIVENGPLKSIGLETKSTFETNSVSGEPSEETSGARSKNMPAANSVALSVPKGPSFQMSAPEDSLDLDDDDDEEKEIPNPLSIAKDDADTKTSKQNNLMSKAAIPENPPAAAQNAHVSSSLLFEKMEKKAPVQPVITEKANGFAFPVAPDQSSQSQPPPTPTMPSPLLDRPDAQTEQTPFPIFSFGAKETKPPTFSPSTSSADDVSGVDCSKEYRSVPTLSTTSGTDTASAEGSTLNKSKPQDEDIFRTPSVSLGTSTSSIPTPGLSFGAPSSSGLSTTTTPAPVFGFGASSASSLSNGSLSTSQSTNSTVSNGLVSSCLTNGVSSTLGSSSLSLFLTSATTTFSTAPTIQFGSGTSETPESATQPLDKPSPVIPEAKPFQASPFNISGLTSQAASSVFPSIQSSNSYSNSVSDVAKPVTMFSSGGSMFSVSTPAVSSSISSPTISSLFASAVGSSSSVASSSAFSTAGSSVFGLNTSQPTGSSPHTFGVTGCSTVSSPLFSGSSANNSVATSSFGEATGRSIFGTQSTQSGTGASQISQGSSTPFGSFSSSPTLAFGGSLSSSIGTSPFGSMTSGVKSVSSTSAFSFSAGASSSGANSSPSLTPPATPGFLFGGSSSQAPTTSVFASTSSSTSPSTGFTFGLSASVSSSSPFTFGSSAPAAFPNPFASSGGTSASSASSSVAPVFGMPNPSPAVGFGSTSPGNDQMNEDSMNDDTNQGTSNGLVPAFGQPPNPMPAPSFVFGSTVVQPASPPVFQFGSNQIPAVPQNPSPFQPGGAVDFTAGGSFSLGSGGGGDKSGRKFVKVKRDKLRKK